MSVSPVFASFIQFGNVEKEKDLPEFTKKKRTNTSLAVKPTAAVRVPTECSKDLNTFPLRYMPLPLEEAPDKIAS